MTTSSLTSTDPLHRRLLVPALVAGAMLACAGFLIFRGASFALSTAFLVVAAGLLAHTLLLAIRAARAILADEEHDELMVASGRRRKELEREKQILQRALKELRFDWERGKISDKDFEEISAAYRVRAIRVMRQLDESTVVVRAQIERAVAARRRHPGEPVAGAGKGEKGEPRAAAKGPLSCPTCHTENERDATFCKRCAARITDEVAS